MPFGIVPRIRIESIVRDAVTVVIRANKGGIVIRGWIGVDLDGTLATHDGKQSKRIGDPIPAMVERVKMWLRDGREVRIVTARAARTSFHIFPYRAEKTRIEQWCLEHIGQVLQIQAHKDYSMIELWDDRAVQVQMNTGKQVGVSRLDDGSIVVETMANLPSPMLEAI